MLSPRDRQVYIEMLKPPPGYQVSDALGTAYSLDLLTLLTIPLSFAFFEKDTKDPDPIALLEAISRHSKTVLIFCEAGRISVPSKPNLLFSQLEHMIFEAVAPSESGAFHPKVWVLRFEPTAKEATEEAPPFYRLLCLSRNLTYDRSWDTSLCLEGVVRGRSFAANRELKSFLEQLPSLSSKRMTPKQKESHTRILSEISKVDFEVPDGFRDFFFWAMDGTGRKKDYPFSEFNYNRCLIMSPFLTQSCLESAATTGKKHIVISRAEALEKIGGAIPRRFAQCYVLHEDTSALDSRETEENVPPTEHQELHAKVYLLEVGTKTTVLTGSANATFNAWHHNVEFCVGLEGASSKFGIDAFLDGAEGKEGIRSLLTDYSPKKAQDADPTEQVKQQLDLFRRHMARSRLKLRCTPAAEPSLYKLSLSSKGKRPFKPLKGFRISKVHCWPISAAKTAASDGRKLLDGTAVVFENLPVRSLTGLIAFRVEGRMGKTAGACEFTLNIGIEGLPASRDDEVVRSIVSDKTQFLKYLLLLLSEEQAGSEIFDSFFKMPPAKGGSPANRHSSLSLPLFEELVRILARSPEKLDRLNELIHTIKLGNKSSDVLPPEFEKIWEPIWAMRQELLVVERANESQRSESA